MKIEEIKIKNYRSLHDVTIYPRDILALVGKNGTGKSNILKALKFFFDGTAKDIDSECFYCHKTECKIEVQLTFNKLTEWEKEQFLPWMDDNRLVICKEVSCDGGEATTISVIAIKKVPENVWLQESQFSGDNINAWWENKDTLKVKDSDFVAYVGGKKPKVGEWKEKAAGFVAINRDEITFVESRIENPKGYAGVLKGALPEFIYIPAVRDIQDETKVGKTNPFGQLINTVIDKITEKQKEVIEEKIKEIELLLNRGGKERIKEITEIETLLNKLISDVMECDIEIQMPMPQLKNIFGDAKIYADDGVRTTIETKGHGLQRSMIFTIMRAYAQLAHSIKAGDKSSERTTIFAVEEPEIYLHPQSQRTLMAVFREIASGNDQVFYSTHSSTFVDIHYFDEICILRIIKEDGLPKTNVNQLYLIELLDDLEVRKGVRPTEVGIREQYSHVFNPLINEGFFADKVLIVEGPSEEYSFPLYARLLEYDLDANNISIVHSDGKGPMDRLLRIFNGFKIPTFTWFDGDKSNADPEIKRKTIELMELLGKPAKIEDVTTLVEDNFAVLEENLETTMTAELPEYDAFVVEARVMLGPIGKPLKSRYVALKIKEKVNAGQDARVLVPRTINSIVEKLKVLQYPGSILKCK